MNILITGIHGFVGSNLVSNLKTQHTIYGLDIVSPQKDGVVKTFGWQELEQIPFVDLIIHLAGKAHDTKNTSKESAYFEINVGLTKKIVEYFLKSNTTKFIYFSSVKAVADSVKGEYLSEEAEPTPGTAYGRSKLEAEKFVTERMSDWEKMRRGDRETERLGDWKTGRWGDREKKVYILRPSMIHGPGNKGNLNLLFQLVSKEIPWPLGAFENKRSFTSMENLQFVIQQIIEKEIEPGTYQMADDHSISTNQLINLIAESQGKKARIWKINTKLITFAAKIGDLFHLPLNSERLKKLTESYVVSNTKLKKALGIEKMPVSAEDGLKETMERMK